MLVVHTDSSLYELFLLGVFWSVGGRSVACIKFTIVGDILKVKLKLDGD